MTDKTSVPVSSSKRRAKQLKLAGVLVLLLGGGGAGAVYWLGMRFGGGDG